MGYKIHRSSRAVFGRRRHPAMRVVLSTIAAIAVVVGGFFVAKWLDTPDVLISGSSSDTVQSTVDTSDVPDTSDIPDVPASTTPTIDDTVRGFYLPHTVLLDSDKLAGTLQQASKAGFNTLLFDVKDGNGALHYRFTSSQAEKVNSYTETALSQEALKDVLSAAKDAGLQVIPRLYAFQDNAAARVLASARITPVGNATWVWYDGDPHNGGKAWLNPYAEEAHLYLLSLIEELKEAGVAGGLLDGVRFPSQDSSANFGSSANTSMDRAEILTAFVDNLQEKLGDTFAVLVASTGKAALGTDTGIYGGNPLTFGAHQAVPEIDLSVMPSSVTVGETVIKISADTPAASAEAVVNHMVLRLKVTGNETTLTPWLDINDLSDDTIHHLLSGCKAGGTEAVILYQSDGQYNFAALAK